MKSIKTKSLRHGDCQGKYVIKNATFGVVKELMIVSPTESLFPALFDSVIKAIDYLELIGMEIIDVTKTDKTFTIRTKDDQFTIEQVKTHEFDRGWVLVEMGE